MIKQKQERLKEVYEHLRRYFGVHTQIDFANAIGLTRPAVSSAMNGNEAYLTDSLFKKICAAYQGVFSLEYLLTGKGTLLTPEEDAKSETIRMEHEQPTAFDTSLLIEKAVEKATAYADRLIASLEKQVTYKDEQLKEKDEMIAMLRHRIAELEAAQVLYSGKDPMKDFPFKHGVAERDEKESARV